MGDKDKKDKHKLSELEEARLEFVGPIVAAAVTECDLAGEELGELILDATRYALESFQATYTNTPPVAATEDDDEFEVEANEDEYEEEADDEEEDDEAFGADLDSQEAGSDDFDIFDADRDA